eukprot:s251_g4.t1
MTLSDMEALDVQDRAHSARLKQQGWLPTKAESPVIRACGPGLPPVGSAAASDMSRRWHERVPEHEVPAYDGLQGHCSHPEVAPAKQLFPVMPDPEGADIKFVMQSGEGFHRGAAGQFSMQGLATLYARLHIKTICFVHFYSGYRRVGDMQHSLDNHWIQNTWQVFCISVDYCLQTNVSNLATGRSHEFWVKQIQSGAIAGVGGGPRCETFTAARFLEGGPPPLRKPTTPLLIRMPSLREHILSLGDRGRCSHGADAHPPLQGRHSDGSFKTAIAKVYPSDMSAAISDAVATFVQSTFLIEHQTQPLSEELSNLGCLDFVSRDHVQEWQASLHEPSKDSLQQVERKKEYPIYKLDDFLLGTAIF